jgi:hypothetical protein
VATPSEANTSNLALAVWKFERFIVLSPDLYYKTPIIAESTQLDHLNKSDLVLSVVGSSKRREKETKAAEKYVEFGCCSFELSSYWLRNTHWLYTTDWEKMERDILRKRGLLTREEESRCAF